MLRSPITCRAMAVLDSASPRAATKGVFQPPKVPGTQYPMA